jgi:transaldolase
MRDIAAAFNRSRAPLPADAPVAYQQDENPKEAPRMASTLDQLKSMTVVVADTGDVDQIERFKPTDCTTNPSLILKAAQMPAYAHLVDEAVAWGRARSGAREGVVAATCDRVAVNFGIALSRLVPGRVSTEVDADLSFDGDASLAKARTLIADYEARGVDRGRILIKLASTWEGIKAAEILEREGINCNLTLLFSMAQARACAEAGVFLISPFVGRILDWHVKATGETYTAETDPGVLSVRAIYAHYKARGFPTVVMGASFRNVGEIEALAGCDRLTIAPALLETLASMQGPLERRLDPAAIKPEQREAPLGEPAFRFAHNENAMATEKLAEGIRQFAADLAKLRTMIAARLA